MLKLPRRKFLHLAAGAAALPAMTRVASALDYPTRPVHIVVGYPAGLNPDIIARLVGQSLSQRLGQPFIIDNRPGAGSNIGTEMVVRAPPDGYTLLMAVVTNTVNATLYQNLSFSFVRDIVPVAYVGGAPAVMVVNPSVPAKTVSEFIAYAKANPGKVNMASAGIGSAPHVFGELFKAMTGVEMLHVPYRVNLLPDLLAGQVQVAFLFTPVLIELIRTDKLRALAVTSARRSDALPDVPTVGESVPGYEASGWYGIGAPTNTSTEIIEKLNKELNGVVSDSGMKARLLELGVEPKPSTPVQFGKLIADDTAKWAKVIKFANIKPE
jgi:tripartite-type tricarboxylate transporter receptor subunit TctC